MTKARFEKYTELHQAISNLSSEIESLKKEAGAARRVSRTAYAKKIKEIQRKNNKRDALNKELMKLEETFVDYIDRL